MTLLEQFIEEGRVEGLVKGREEGRVEGRSILHKQLSRRFGKLSKAQVRAIESADLAAIERWSVGVFEVDSVAELLKL